MPDLPDYYTMTSMPFADAYTIRGGADAAKSAAPESRDVYLATDTQILYICVTDGVWTGFDASILVQGTLTLYEDMDANSKKITSLAAPAADGDAARKKYVDDAIGTDIAAHAALTATHGVTGAILGTEDVDDTPVDGATTVPVSSNWAYDHAALTIAHGATGAVVGTTNTQTLTNKTLTSPTINGTIATTGLTMPAFTAGGDITLGANKIKTTSCLLKETETNVIGVRSLADDGWKILEVSGLRTESYVILMGDAGCIYTPNLDGYYTMLQARDSGVGYVEIARLQGAADPYFGMGYLGGGLRVHYSNTIDARSNRIQSVADPTAAQDAATKAYVDSLFPHGAAQHTDVTRELFIPASEGYIAAGTLANQHRASVVLGLANADEPNVYLTMKVPDDFVSFSAVKAVWQCGGTGNLYWRITASYGASGEADDNHTDTPALATSAIAASGRLYVIEPANALSLTDLAAGDILGLNPYREGSNASDTIDATVILLGLIFEYVAEQ